MKTGYFPLSVLAFLSLIGVSAPLGAVLGTILGGAPAGAQEVEAQPLDQGFGLPEVEVGVPAGGLPAYGAPAAVPDQHSVQRLDAALGELYEQNPEVAIVEGETITWRQIMDSAADLPDGISVESYFPALLDRLIDIQLLTQEAYDEDLDEDSDVTDRLQVVLEAVMRQVLITRVVAERVDEDLLRDIYTAQVAQGVYDGEVKVRHILLESRPDAQVAIWRLESGSRFEDVARAYSLGPSAQNGGDLGWLTRARMIPEFADAAFALEPGDYTREPVQTAYGWHVILVEERKQDPVPTFEEARPRLLQLAQDWALRQFLAELRDAAEIELFPAYREE